MANYLKEVQERSATPDVNIVAMSYVRISPIPKRMQSVAGKITKKTIEEVVELASDYIHPAARSEVYIRDGSIIYEVIMSAPISDLLSTQNLSAAGILAKIGYAYAITKTTVLTLEELEKCVSLLTKQVKKTSQAIASLILWLSGEKEGGNTDTLVVESRTGVLGNLDRSFSAARIVRSNISPQRKMDSVKRLVSNLSKIEEFAKDDLDRVGLCSRLTEATKGIKTVTLDGLEGEEHEIVTEFNKNVRRVKSLIKKICLTS